MAKKSDQKKRKKMNRREFLTEVAKGGGYFVFGIGLTEVISHIPTPGKKDPYTMPGGAGDFEGV